MAHKNLIHQQTGKFSVSLDTSARAAFHLSFLPNTSKTTYSVYAHTSVFTLAHQCAHGGCQNISHPRAHTKASREFAESAKTSARRRQRRRRGIQWHTHISEANIYRETRREIFPAAGRMSLLRAGIFVLRLTGALWKWEELFIDQLHLRFSLMCALEIGTFCYFLVCLEQ